MRRTPQDSAAHHKLLAKRGGVQSAEFSYCPELEQKSILLQEGIGSADLLHGRYRARFDGWTALFRRWSAFLRPHHDDRGR